MNCDGQTRFVLCTIDLIHNASIEFLGPRNSKGKNGTLKTSLQCPSVCLFVRLSICLSIRLFVCLSVCASVCPCVRQSGCPSVRLSVSWSVRVVRPVRLSVCPSVSSTIKILYLKQRNKKLKKIKQQKKAHRLTFK